MWITALLLLTLGICMLLSISMASGVRAQAGDESQGSLLLRRPSGHRRGRRAWRLMFAVTRLDYRRLRKLSLLFMGVVALSLLAVHIPGVGHRVNGASSYIPVGPLSYQPSEFAKLAVVLAGAHFMSTPRVKDGRMRSYLLPFGAMGLVLCALVVWENDFGTAIIIMGLVVGMLWLAGMKTKQWLLLTGGGALAGGGLMLLVAAGQVHGQGHGHGGSVGRPPRDGVPVDAVSAGAGAGWMVRSRPRSQRAEVRLSARSSQRHDLRHLGRGVRLHGRGRRHRTVRGVCGGLLASGAGAARTPWASTSSPVVA